MVGNMPDLSLTPFALGLGPEAQVSQAVVQFNASLDNVTEACLTDTSVCANPDTYMFWDTVHPTTKVHAIFADRFRADFCKKEQRTPGLRGRADEMPPPAWRGTCFGKH